MNVLCSAQSLSRVQLFVTWWTVAHQAPLSMGFSRQEYWSGLPCPPPGDLPNPGIKFSSPHCRWIPYHLNHRGSPRILEWVAMPSSRGSSQPRDQIQFSALQVDSLPSEPPGKPKNTGVGGLSLLFSIPRNRTRVSCSAGRFFTSWATKEAPEL